MAYPTTVTNTGANLRAQDADNAAELWKEGADMFERTEDIFDEFEGGPNSLIQVENDLSAGRGHLIHFRVESDFFGPGRKNDELFTSADHFEELKMSESSLQVGCIRNAYSSNMLVEEDLGMRGDLENRQHEKLGAWMGREKTWEMCTSAIHQCDISNHFFANGRNNLDGLQSGDGLSPDDIVMCDSMLSSMGGRPAEVKMDKMGNKVNSFVFLTTQHGSASLEVDPDYKANLRAMAAATGHGSTLTTGGLIPVNGNVVRKWQVVDHDGEGPLGSPLSPKAYLGVPIVDGTTADLTGTGRGITGGGDATTAAKTKYMFFRDFPRYAITFCNQTTVSATASTHQLITGNKFYVTIVNPANAATDPRKWCIYRCTVNDGNEITVDLRLSAPAASGTGISNSTVGDVTWDSAKNTTVHPAGALVYVSNASGKPLFKTLVMGRTFARRGYGQFRNKRFYQKQEGGFVNEIYIGSIFGQKPRANRRGMFPGLIVLHHTGTYPGWSHP